MWSLVLILAWFIDGGMNYDQVTIGIYPSYDDCLNGLVERATREISRGELTLPRGDYRVMQIQFVCTASEEGNT